MSNQIPTEKTIKKLEARNKELLKYMKIEYPNTKLTNDLELSIKLGLVRKSWVGVK